jgi:hypothetical protein
MIEQNKNIRKFIQPNNYNYFLMQKINRYNFICNLLSQYDDDKIKNINFISLGCGLGGEESWLTEKFKKVTLLDADSEIINTAKGFYKKANIKGNYKFISKSVEKTREPANFDEKFDIIFTSSPTDWMNAPNWSIPKHYVEFVENHLTDNGIFISRLYGGRNPWRYDESLNNNNKLSFKSFKPFIKSLSYTTNLKLQGLYRRGEKEWNELNKKDNFPPEMSKGRITNYFMIVTKRDFSDKSISFYNYDEDNIYPIQFSFDIRKLNVKNYIERCDNLISKLKIYNFKNKLKNNDFIGDKND